MYRRSLTLAVLLAVILLGAGELFAQQGAWPAMPVMGKNWRGPGHYLSWIKILSCWSVFLAWVCTTDWVSRDALQMRMDYLRWNPIVFGSFFAAFVLVWVIPWFWLAFGLLMVAYIAPLASYIIYRNSKVSNEQRVLTREHVRWWAAQRLAAVGIKVAAAAQDPHTKGAPLQLRPRGGPNAPTENAWLATARQSPGWADSRKILADGLACRASAIMLDYTQQAATLSYLVDGVWLARGPQARETADPALETLKILCGLSAQERRARQDGKFSAEYYVLKDAVFKQIEKAKDEYRKKLTIDLTKKMASPEVEPAALQLQVRAAVAEKVRKRFASPIGPWTPVQKSDVARIKGAGPLNPDESLEPAKALGTLTAQGTQTGERVLIQFEEKKARLHHSLDDLGMRAKMQEQLKELLGREQGFVLFSAPPANGLRTTTHLVLRGLDRLVREFEAVEEETNRYDEIENIRVTTYKAADKESPATVLPKVFRMEPNVVVVRDLVNAETVQMMCEEIADNRLLIGTVRAKDAAEALLRVLALGVPPPKFSAGITAVLSQRLVRKLCEVCREAYVPPPQVMQQLGIPQGRVQTFYRPPQQSEETCVACGGVGYIGRTAIFELLVVDDAIRKALCTAPKLEVLRSLARKSGSTSSQEEGIVLVAKGVTSLPELMRILK